MSEDLQKQNEKLQMQLKGMQASISAHKQLLNENLDAMTTLRTNLLLFQQSHHEVSTQLGAAKKEVENLSNALAVANAEADQLRVELHNLKNPAPVDNQPIAE